MEMNRPINLTLLINIIYQFYVNIFEYKYILLINRA